MKPIIPRERANTDIDDAIDHLLTQRGPDVALAFVDAVEAAWEQLSQHPATGSPRYAQELGLPGLRCWTIVRFRYLVLYFEREDHIDVWRVLHGARHVPTWLVEP